LKNADQEGREFARTAWKRAEHESRHD
jgi:hypothetical protein